MGVHGEVELIEGEPVLDGEGRLGDEVGGARSDYVYAQHPAGGGVGHHLDQAFGLTKGESPARGRERKAPDFDLEAALLRVLFAQADVRDLGIRVHAVGRGVVVGDAHTPSYEATCASMMPPITSPMAHTP